MKSYSALSGYVYQYVYAGPGAEPGTHVFEVSADRRQVFPVTVRVRPELLPAWTREPGCALDSSYVYAIAKLSLAQAFDERPGPPDLAAPVEPDAARIAAILETLGAG